MSNLLEDGFCCFVLALLEIAVGLELREKEGDYTDCAEHDKVVQIMPLNITFMFQILSEN